MRPVHMRIGMHMHPDPMALIRFEPRMLPHAPAARRQVVADGVEAGMGMRVYDVERRRTTDNLWIQKTPGVQRRQASRFLAHYLAWRQEAANHHDIDCACQSRAHPGRRQGPRPDSRFGGQFASTLSCVEL